MDDFDGKVAVVTGAASGIGRAMADRWAGLGMRLALADIEAGPLEAAADELRSGGADVVTSVIDVADGDQMDAFAAVTFEAYDGVHILCNNAGVGGGGQMWTLTTADWEWVLGVNLWGVIHGIRAFVPQMVDRGEGHVVNTASVAGLSSPPMMGPYNASKHAVVTISETLRSELGMIADGDFGVTAVCPGWVQTRIAESERNRPEALRNPGVDAAAEAPAVAGAVKGFLDQGLTPAELAVMVEDAVRSGDPYVLTGDEWGPLVQFRLDALTEAIGGQSTA